MSVVVAKRYEDRIEISADTIVVTGFMKGQMSKLYKLSNGIVIGAAGSVDEIQYVVDNIEEVAVYAEKPFDAKVLRKSLRDMCEKWVEKLSADYLMIIKGKLYQVDGLAVVEVEEGAVGAGTYFAQTVLKTGGTPEQAVKIACEMSHYCNTPIESITVPLASKEQAQAPALARSKKKGSSSPASPSLASRPDAQPAQSQDSGKALEQEKT